LLGTRADGWLDAAALGLTAITMLLAVSVSAVRRGKARFHRRLQLTLASVAVVIVVLLEWRFRMVGWRDAARPSRYFPFGVDLSLGIHIAFAVMMVVGWIGAVTIGMRSWQDGTLRVDRRVAHRRWGKFATVATLGTTITAWIFYIVAFVM